MDIKELSNDLSVTSQVTHGDITQAAEKGIKTVICNRPDNEAEDQPTASELQALSESLGMKFYYLPVIPGQITDGDIKDFQQLLNQVEAPILAYCRTGTRSASLWALSQVNTYGKDSVLAAASAAGYDLSNLSARLDSLTASASPAPSTSHDVVIIGGGAAGQAVAASLYQREPDLDIAIIEPSDQHFYQPGWTMVGGGVFTQDATVKAMSEVMPNRSTWYQDSVISFSPDENAVLLENGGAVGYRTLVVAPGLSLNWDAIPGLTDTLGSNGVTSNYRFDLAPYTWELINQLKKGEAVFT
ncbi:MAG: TIGR01244 family sulfur transferase, partial [Pontibacterium sp.]